MFVLGRWYGVGWYGMGRDGHGKHEKGRDGMTAMNIWNGHCIIGVYH